MYIRRKRRHIICTSTKKKQNINNAGWIWKTCVCIIRWHKKDVQKLWGGNKNDNIFKIYSHRRYFIHFVSYFFFLYFFQFVACVVCSSEKQKKIKTSYCFFSACNIKKKKCYDFIKKYYNHFLVIFLDIYIFFFCP